MDFHFLIPTPGGSGRAYYPKPRPLVDIHKPHPGVSEKTAAHIQAMADRWRTEQFPSRVTKAEPDPLSVSSIKLSLSCHRHMARKHIEKVA
jgi:hypothetical protein